MDCPTCGEPGAAAAGACLRCACVLLDDHRVPTLQKIVRCSAACRMLDAGLAVLPANPSDAARLGASAVRALAGADDELAACLLGLAFGLVALADAQQGDEPETGEEVVTKLESWMVRVASEELEEIRAQASAHAQPACCAALLVLIAGMISPEQCADVDADWLRTVHAELGEGPAIPHARLASLLKRWLLGTNAMRVDACALVAAACQLPELGAWLAQSEVSDFVLEALRCADTQVATSALDALYCVTQHTPMHGDELRGEAENALFGRPSARAVPSTDGAGSGYDSSFRTCLAHSAPTLVAMLVGDRVLTLEQRDRAWALLCLIDCRAASSLSAPLHGLLLRMVPCDTADELKCLLTIGANLTRASALAPSGHWKRTLDEPRGGASSTQEHDLPAAAICALSTFALTCAHELVTDPDQRYERPLAGGGVLDQDTLADVCACAAFALANGGPDARLPSSTATHMPPPQSTPRLARVATMAPLADACYAQLVLPLLPWLHELSRRLAASLLVITEAVLLTTDCAVAEQATERATKVLRAICGNRQVQRGFAFDEDAALLHVPHLLSLLAGVALRALGLPGVEQSVPPLPSLLLAAAVPQPTSDSPPQHDRGRLQDGGDGGGSDWLRQAISDKRTYTPHHVLENWLAPQSQRAAPDPFPDFAVDVLYASEFCLGLASEHRSSGQLSKVRAALSALFSSHSRVLALTQTRSTHTLCRLLRIWVRLGPSAPVPAKCAPALELLLTTLDEQLAYGGI
ncbi:hypothetical protein T492DRAFT_1140972 [Pavlovales sp. CCMP2436]|nr:hypothetical protein T492DRAFT_1140972 [Pavlovales sp. CCMP2436]